MSQANLSWDAVLRASLDPRDKVGRKNRLVDDLQWAALKPRLSGARRVLEIGCALGRFAPRVLASGAAYTGVDASAGLIETAKGLHDAKASFAWMDGGRLPFETYSFDVAFTCHGLVKLLSDPNRDMLLGEMARVLKPYGRLVAVEPAAPEGGNLPTVAAYRTLLEKTFTVAFPRVIRVPLGGATLMMMDFIEPRFPEFHSKWVLPRINRRETARARAAALSSGPCEILIEGNAANSQFGFGPTPRGRFDGGADRVVQPAQHAGKAGFID